MKVPTVKNAPFGLPLITGVKIIGFIHLVVYALIFLVVLVKEREHHESTGGDHESTGNDSWTIDEESHIHDNSTDSNSTVIHNIPDEIIHESFLDLSASYFNDFALIVQVTFAVFLLLGVYQKNIDFIMSWVLLQVANMVFSFFFLVIYFVAVFRIYYTGYIQYLICEEITVSLVVGYCTLVVYSHVAEVGSEARQDEPLSPIVANQD